MTRTLRCGTGPKSPSEWEGGENQAWLDGAVTVPLQSREIILTGRPCRSWLDTPKPSLVSPLDLYSFPLLPSTSAVFTRMMLRDHTVALAAT